MPLVPEPGLVIRYDFLWKEEQDAGAEQGYKDRPCAVILTSTPREDGSRLVMLCPITHSPPQEGETGVEIPARVAHYLHLDEEHSWIKTHQVNTLIWEKDRLPFGLAKAYGDEWSFGQLPQQIGRQAFEQVHKNAQQRNLRKTARSNE